MARGFVRRELGPLAALALAWAGAAAGMPPDAGAVAERSVPIHQIVADDGRIFYSIPLRAAGEPPVEALLDTGSTGLRIAAPAVPQARADGLATVYSYGSGLELRGTIAPVALELGAGAAGTVPVQVVGEQACVAAHPSCRAAGLSEAERFFRHGPNELTPARFGAILGISLAPHGNGVPNPL